MPGPVACMISFRLGGTDGVSVEADKWRSALATIGFEVSTIAGSGTADRVLPGLMIDADEPPTSRELADALAPADLVVVENLCSLPLNPRAAAGVAGTLAGRRAVLHHHDLPWQRPRFTGFPPPPDDPAWAHATINALSRFQLAGHGIEATVVRNTFDVDTPVADRAGSRAALGFADDERVVMQPTRALDRKGIPAALALAEALGATYWLLGPAEDGFGPELDHLLGAARCRVLHRGPTATDGLPGSGMAAAYAACDVVALPSTWEGFGNPTVESAIHHRPLAVGPYPVARELAAFGFRWFRSDDVPSMRSYLRCPDDALVTHNRYVAGRHFSTRALPGRLTRLFEAHRWRF